MEPNVRLSLVGLEALHKNVQAEILVRLRHELDPLATRAGVRLVISITGRHRGDLNLRFDSEAPARPGVCTRPRYVIFGNEGGEEVYVREYMSLRVCGPANPKTGKQDTRKVLTYGSVLGRALANCALHELGHIIADFEDLKNMPTNYMFSGTEPDTFHRTRSSMRDFYAGHQTFNPDQKETIVRQIKLKEWLGEKNEWNARVNGQ
jgi:hypothetical protein